MVKYKFPDDFIWGVATSAYQIEGAYNKDGKGENIWDRFTSIPGNIYKNHNGNVACDHYHLYQSDINILKELGIKNYRFSISWARIFPDGYGKVNQKGIEYYRRLINALLDKGIQPAITLYHWDLPQELQDIGGWTNKKVVDYFVEYAELMFKEFGDLVPIWITHNEPWVVSILGHAWGVHAPGIKDYKIALKVAHNILLSHGKVVKLYRSMSLKGKIGITLNLSSIHSATDSEKDLLAAKIYDGFMNRWFLDAILKGSYPEDMKKLYNELNILPQFSDDDMKIINERIDFLGINYYTRSVVKYDENAYPLKVSMLDLDNPKTDMGWEIYPKGLYELLINLHKNYDGIDILITENGAAFNDIVNYKGKVVDDYRIDYLYRHLLEAYRAICDGVNLKGYYLWSFLDNFEWAEGYSKRFGIVFVDYNTQKRIIKDSAYWYSDVIKNNGITE
ncbi:broad-specificity cellobiase [Caloramator fervidus]|uniref:Beta-glucosidase n=1 Tax=Caloramator fervidus TaxID=29344 RepID=A0A1H5XKT3_9CLOT|nr:GH1 family beta-glucosidase [Caloramator fervidus]SEG12050.1 broad-specificity cellobiase [Caloramator fervidus]